MHVNNRGKLATALIYAMMINCEARDAQAMRAFFNAGHLTLFSTALTSGMHNSYILFEEIK
jgi:hypothetical protein